MNNHRSISYRTFSAMFLLACALLLTLVKPAYAASTGWLVNPQHPPLQVQLELTGQFNPQQKAVEAVLSVQLENDWKTYWRSPGEGGVSPSLQWENSTNISDVQWHWPAPKRYPLLGVDTLGYKGVVHFPMTFFVEDITKPATLEGTLTMSSCTNICVLTDYQIYLNFTPDAVPFSQEAMHKYNQGMSAVPAVVDTTKDTHVLNNARAHWHATASELTIQVNNSVGWNQPDLFVDDPSGQLEDVIFSKPNIQINGEQLTATVSASSWIGDIELLNKTLHVTVVDKNISAELVVTTSNQPITTEKSSLWSIIAVALLGGLILNIMPCVLPVLGMKLSSVLTAHGLEKKQIRRQFIASAAGIMVSFWIIAAFLLTLKLSGQALGWGIQFQSPYFIAIMIGITVLFAANMLGLFEIQLSSGMQTWLATRGDQSYLGHFLQGMFATLLATPCSAPFLGTAVAFALGASTVELFAIFTALAIGMALPWLAIAAFPGLAQCLPKPGKWMNTVKTIFGLLILATSFWLLSLLAIFIGTLATVITGLLLVITLLYLLGMKQGKKAVILVSAILTFSFASALIIGSVTSDSWATPLPEDHAWQPLQVKDISSHVNMGKVVFVNVTADWCITCKANKIGVLLQQPVYGALQAADVVPMEGDWTVPSDYVTEFLQSNGQFGVPFNMVYGPNAPQGIPLPTILSTEQVMKAIEHARG
ncbi:thioredoxin family protein [Vibrio sp. Of7-15]|uniref:protein-disulfide reductase DsbD family protein n=1 Tax=Vibrio sp. Of7-15 TaxID=2724879 RepID=UPI001EF2E33B|nr:protein-disulfide reductase DsbD domain-containing protein [Vibrio sp. Of7-15]MCG7498793.1 thioredoxin family protein [Vibrio sp. Of7-15]